jgi:cellulose synthase/poly-beta-1,6-N-acetylglucosamine synthase-like glycosyltransferase/PleD family two-component response regulator
LTCENVHTKIVKKSRAPVDDPGVNDLAVNERRDTALVVSCDAAVLERLRDAVQWVGCTPLCCTTPEEALERLEEVSPNLLVLDAPRDDEGKPLSVLEALRRAVGGDGVPALVLTEGSDLRLAALMAGADDVVDRDVATDDLRARLQARLMRPSASRRRVPTDPVTGTLTAEASLEQLRHEAERAARTRRPGVLALLSFHELPALRAELGARAGDELLAQAVRIVKADGRLLDAVGTARGQLALLMPGTDAAGAQIRLERLMRELHSHEFGVSGGAVQLTPLMGYAVSEPGLEAVALEERAWVALRHAAEQLDLHPTRWRAALGEVTGPGSRNILRRWRTALQVVGQQMLCFGIPMCLYALTDALGFDATWIAYLIVTAAVTFTAAGIWAESLLALRRTELPPAPPGALPKASAVIAAYLPNEADTVIETVEAFLRHDYPNLQIVLAYNTPQPMAVERTLRAIAEANPRFLPLRVEGSISKAQNVNAALARVDGEFVGIFDADHHPAPLAFRRAWRWIASGVDVVQGHCVVRNGADGLLTRLVAAEFETIYAVSHPGRARLHGFAIFGGSNGFWRRETLARTRLRSFMLTEDIDSSLRVLRAGGRIVSDPGLVSTELAPNRVGALWRQRLRWAQGWSQVSLRHLPAVLRTPQLSARQRLGALHLLGWREVVPWICMQVGPLLAYWVLRGEPLLSWLGPVFAATTMFAVGAGVLQTCTAWHLAHPSVRRWAWFLGFAVFSQFAFTRLKNVAARTAHIKQAMREDTWTVTPRSTPPLHPQPVPRQEPSPEQPEEVVHRRGHEGVAMRSHRSPGRGRRGHPQFVVVGGRRRRPAHRTTARRFGGVARD